MATEATTAPTISTGSPPGDIEFHPIDWWAGVAVGPQLVHQRRVPPIPAFVRLSRLVDPATLSAARNKVPVVETEEGTEIPDVGDLPEPLNTDSTPVSGRGWADSAGRPLFQIGLAAIVIAIVVAVVTFAQQDDGSTTVESRGAAIVIQPGSDEAGPAAGGPTASPDEAIGASADNQTGDVLEALVRQTSTGTDADLSVVATASGSGTDVRWTATVRNAGPGTAEGPITVVQTIGSDFELVSIAGNSWECEHLRATGTITCELDGDLATGQRRRLDLVTSTTGVAPGTPIPGTMSVVAGTNDPDLDNNTITVTAVSASADNGEGENSRSSSAGAAGKSDTDTDTSGAADSDQTGTAGLDELPHTGSGLVVALGAAGVMLCLIGYRLMTWSARAQTRTLLVAASIE